jgi:hypothetical protein
VASFRDNSSTRWWLSLSEGVAFGVLLFVGSWALLGENGFGGALIGYCLTWVWLCVIRAGRARRRLVTIWTTPPYRLSIDDEGIAAISEGGSLWRRWNRVSKLVVRREWVTIVFDGLETLTIPESAFGDEERREKWLSYVSARVPVPTE